VTDGQTDGLTESIIAKTALCIASYADALSISEAKKTICRSVCAGSGEIDCKSGKREATAILKVTRSILVTLDKLIVLSMSCNLVSVALQLR